VTEQGGSAPTERAGEGQPVERVVIRDRRKIDVTGGTRGKAGESGRDGRPDPSARSGGRAGSRDMETPPERTEPAGGVADAGGKIEDDSGAAVRQAERGESGKGTRAESREDGDRHPAGADTRESGERGEAGQATPGRPDSEESTEAGVLESAGLEEAAGATEDATGATTDAVPEALGAELQALRADLDERTKDLQRVSAEYANYRKRVDRDRGLVAEQATGAVLSALLPVLDDLDRAREHGDLVGPFGAVAEQLTGSLAKFGLSPFGEKGDPLDPTRHEAVAHLTSAEVSEPTCIDVMRRGYLLGDRLLRPALVAVADPE
jgi:molecular chaperone GrpE